MKMSVVRFIGGGLLAGAALVLACGSSVDDEQAPVLVNPSDQSPPQGEQAGAQSGADDPSKLPVLGTWRGHFDGATGAITFTPLDQAAEKSGLQPQVFGTQTTNYEFTTSNAIVQNNGSNTGGNVNPAANVTADQAKCTFNATAEGGGTGIYFTSGSHNVNGSVCNNKHLCAMVTLRNTSTKYLDKTYVELSGFSPTYSNPTDTRRFRGDNNNTVPYSLLEPDGYPAAYGLDPDDGLWSYGTINPNTTSAGVRWDIYLPTCEDFSWTTTVKGSPRTEGYTVTGPTTLTTFDDACTKSDAYRPFSAGQDSSGVSTRIAVHFPFPLYGHVFGNANIGGGLCNISAAAQELCKYIGNIDGVRIGANGLLGDLPDNGFSSNPTGALPSAIDYAMFPFWDQVSLPATPTAGNGNVVAGDVCQSFDPTVTTVGSRRWLVTWKNVTTVSTGGFKPNLTFTAVLEEATSSIHFQYRQWSRDRTCGTTTVTSRGRGATFGIEGANSAASVAGGSVHIADSTTTTILPDISGGCPAVGVGYRFTPNP